jgi:hypothetical protein
VNDDNVTRDDAGNVTIRVHPAVARAEALPIKAMMRSSFNARWIDIALKQEAEAKEARHRAEQAGDDGQRRLEAMQDERRASMVGISAASHAIDALYGTVRDLIDLPRGWSRAGKRTTPADPVGFWRR